MRSIEICAGAGGQALGLEQAGFEHVALVELDKSACSTLRKNRPEWNILEVDVHAFSTAQYHNISLFAGGVPCPPFSIAGKQLGKDDERDLFPAALRLIAECSPKAVLLENVRGLLSPKFNEYRQQIVDTLDALGYWCEWKLLNASDFGVPQLRPRAIMVALKKKYSRFYVWPNKTVSVMHKVGMVLQKEMASNGWELVHEWAHQANAIAPTLVGGSKKHGGADLGPTRAKLAWAKLGVDGKGLADSPPEKGFSGIPRLTVKMAGLIQGFPSNWEFTGKKTSAYRQVGNAFPPPVAKAIGLSIMSALIKGENTLEDNYEEDNSRRA